VQLVQLGTSTQAHNGKPVPYISYLITGLLHDSIEDGGQSQASIAERFGEQVAAILVDCTDTAEGLTGAGKEPWGWCARPAMWLGAHIQLLPGGHASRDPWHLGGSTAEVALQRDRLAVFAKI